MRTTYLLLFFLLISAVSFAEEKRIAATFIFDRSEPAEGLSDEQALFHFKFKNLDKEDESAEITLSCDGGENELFELKNGAFEYRTSAGTHHFTIYINDKYFEMYSHNLLIEAGRKDFYSVRTSKTEGMQIQVYKPIIYLYPEKTSSFEVSVTPKGEMAFTYPRYEDKWTGTMHPNGNIDIDGETFRYLFWESNQRMDALDPKETPGFVVKGENITQFLAEKLNQVGFSASERADFITYWGPQIQAEEQVFITFHQDSECDAFAELNISPTPDNIHRLYISWGAYSGQQVPESQELRPFNRDGFTVIEWGGQEIPTISNTLSL
ncbi:MAG: hypothetical protein NXI10_13105 [bacterium]|nr:hypothetical protein [bacterium]